MGPDGPFEAKLEDVSSTLQTMPTMEIPEIEIAALLNNDPDYREILPRVRIERLFSENAKKTLIGGGKVPTPIARTQAQLSADEKALADMKEGTAGEDPRAPRRIEMEKEKRQTSTSK